MLFAILRPAALAGMLVAFLLALTLRVVAMRLTARVLGLADRRGRLLPHPREDIDPFGAVTAAIIGIGWGRAFDVSAVPRWASRGRRVAVVAAGPLAPLLAGLLALTAYRLSFAAAMPTSGVSAVLRGGWSTSPAADFLLSFGFGLLGFALLNLIPLPPLDGFALLWVSLRRVGPGGQWAQEWLVEKNLGVLILLIAVFFPLGYPFIYFFVDLLALPFLWTWG